MGEVGEEVGDGAVEGGVYEGWGDFGQRGQDEAALMEGGMGEGEVGGLEDGVGVEQEIEVEDARALGWSVGAVAAHGVFDREELVEEDVWGEGSFEEGGGVEETRLVEIAYRVGGVEGGDGGDMAEGGEAGEGLAEVGFGRAVGGGEVGAEGDGGGHAQCNRVGWEKGA